MTTRDQLLDLAISYKRKNNGFAVLLNTYNEARIKMVLASNKISQAMKQADYALFATDAGAHYSGDTLIADSAEFSTQAKIANQALFDIATLLELCGKKIEW